jgi:uncharacterized repeat protein (TIGR02543 family)
MGNKTFYARWTNVIYTIAYNLDGGINNEANPASYTVEGSAITLADPTRSGYIFGGWHDNSSFTGSAVTAIPAGSTENKTFYARWTNVIYTIAYNLDGGTNNAANPASYTTESPAITLAAPTRSGSIFGGWHDNSNFTGSAVTAIPTGSMGNKTFYARWVTAYTIAYNLDGGINNGANPAFYTIESPEITLAAPTRPGYTFVGWYTDDSFTTAGSVIPTGNTGNKIFYAKWLSGLFVNISVWINTDGDILISNDDITISKSSSGYNATFTAQVSGTYSAVRWHINGEPIYGDRGAAQSITINAADYVNGPWYLGAQVSKDGIPYSTTIHFTVTN